jgi:hypothetical protein
VDGGPTVRSLPGRSTGHPCEAGGDYPHAKGRDTESSSPRPRARALLPGRWSSSEREFPGDVGSRRRGAASARPRTVNGAVFFRSETPDRIAQEICGAFIAHNVVRMSLHRAAHKGPTSPLRLSFVVALERVREAVRDLATVGTTRLPERYARLLRTPARVTVPLRPGRRSPREVKSKMSSYPGEKPSHAAYPPGVGASRQSRRPGGSAPWNPRRPAPTHATDPKPGVRDQSSGRIRDPEDGYRRGASDRATRNPTLPPETPGSQRRRYAERAKPGS